MNIRMVVNLKDRMLFGSIYIGVPFFFYSNASKFKFKRRLNKYEPKIDIL